MLENVKGAKGVLCMLSDKIDDEFLDAGGGFHFGFGWNQDVEVDFVLLGSWTQSKGAVYFVRPTIPCWLVFLSN